MPLYRTLSGGTKVPFTPEEEAEWEVDVKIRAAEELELQRTEMREERRQRLLRSDWVVVRSHELGTPIPPAWIEYRQALRDITTQPGFPTNIVWPTIPDQA